MIRSALCAALLVGWAAFAQDGGVAPPAQPAETVPEPEIDTSIDAHRAPIDALTERMIGSASKSVRFDWRRSPAGFGIVASELLERNNFGSARLGVSARKSFDSLMMELAVTRVFTWSTTSSQKLALTPYRQIGRPSHFELDINAGIPIAEGVVTALPAWVPPAELVLSANGGFRYLFYPGSIQGKDFLGTLGNVLQPKLSEDELSNLEGERLGGMQIDPARYGLLAGLTVDVYFQPGFFVSPRAMIAVPLLHPATGSGLGLWWELNLGLGFAL